MMYSIKIKRFLPILLITVFVSLQFAFSQTYKLDNNTCFMEVHGTSSLHDWHVDALEQSGKIVVKDSASLMIEALNFSVKSESLKSGKSGMDKNTYKALKTDKYKTIDFKFLSVESIESISDNYYKVSIKGDMTICDVTNSISLAFKLKLDNNKVLIDGEKSLLMTDYGIEPPKALLGTIKTGDKIRIIFKSVFLK